MSLVLLKLEQGYHFGDVLLGKSFPNFTVLLSDGRQSVILLLSQLLW
jgi:hypothetical protein